MNIINCLKSMFKNPEPKIQKIHEGWVTDKETIDEFFAWKQKNEINNRLAQITQELRELAGYNAYSSNIRDYSGNTVIHNLALKILEQESK